MKMCYSHQYGDRGGRSTKVSQGAHGCGLWRSIQVGWDSFSEHLAFEAREGNLIIIWQDWWSGDTSFKTLYPDLF